MKYGKYVLTFVTVFLFCMISNASAITKTSFSIETGASWAKDIASTAHKIEGNHFSAIEWTYSNKASHKMWFRVTDDFGKVRGSGLLNYLSTDAFQTNLKYYDNLNYVLEAKREHITNPRTLVKGRWTP